MEPYITSVEDVPLEDVKTEGAINAKIQWLISSKVAPNFAMRRFTLEEKGCTPYHEHDWEHEVFVLDGEGLLVYGDERKECRLRPGNVVFVPAGIKHQFKNLGKGMFRFLCIIPIKESKC